MKHLLWIGIIFAMSVGWEVHSNNVNSSILKWHQRVPSKFVILYGERHEPYLYFRPDITPLEIKWDSSIKGGETR
jgi:hypothetical protein